VAIGAVERIADIARQSLFRFDNQRFAQVDCRAIRPAGDRDFIGNHEGRRSGGPRGTGGCLAQDAQRDSRAKDVRRAHVAFGAINGDRHCSVA
jgi:hypothetical protein